MVFHRTRTLWFALIVLVGCCLDLRAGNGVNYEEAPIRYSATKPVDNDIARLQSKLDSGEVQLRFDPQFGYLPNLLEKLQIAAESQSLVFSKTSLQNDKIGPANPRAIYFNDRIHLGYVQDGVIEIAAVDSKLGMAFYTLRQEEVAKPTLERQANRCMSCHGVARTRGVPGVLVRSVFPDRTGAPVIAAGSYQSTHRSPIAQRWGGWYVTGSHGNQTHLGNFILDQPKKPKSIDNQQGMNLRTLTDRLNASKYLRPTSDVVALMVLEHQVDVLNLLTQANFVAQHAFYQFESAIADGEPREYALERMNNRVTASVKPLMEALFFADEPRLNEPIRGDATFTNAFVSAGIRSTKGNPFAISTWITTCSSFH